MSLFPRMSTFGPMRHEYGPFFNLFNDTFNELQRLPDTLPSSSTFTPKFDVKEAKDSYVLEGELPGINPKDVSIEFSDEQTLVVKGRTEASREEGQRPQAATKATEGDNAAAAPENDSGAPSADTGAVAKTGSTEVAKHEPQHTYWVTERSVGEFVRSFSLANRVDQENVKASLKNGILRIVVPKLAKAKTTHRVTIEEES